MLPFTWVLFWHLSHLNSTQSDLYRNRILWWQWSHRAPCSAAEIVQRWFEAVPPHCPQLSPVCRTCRTTWVCLLAGNNPCLTTWIILFFCLSDVTECFLPWVIQLREKLDLSQTWCAMSASVSSVGWHLQCVCVSAAARLVPTGFQQKKRAAVGHCLCNSRADLWSSAAASAGRREAYQHPATVKDHEMPSSVMFPPRLFPSCSACSQATASLINDNWFLLSSEEHVSYLRHSYMNPNIIGM